jgi:TerC family integral membrane protein
MFIIATSSLLLLPQQYAVDAFTTSPPPSLIRPTISVNVLSRSPLPSIYSSSRSRNSSSSSSRNSRLYLGSIEEENKTIDHEAGTNANVNAKVDTSKEPNNSIQSILQPGGGPTVVIEPNELDETIYASAITRTLSWVAAAVLFGFGLYLSIGQEVAEEFFAGYLVEQSLSIDNLFVFLLLFDYFKVPLANQDRVLNYGIYGAIIMRAVMIGLGSVALSQSHGILLVFAAILIYSSANVLLGGDDGDEEEDMSENSIVKFSRKLIDSTDEFDGNRFFTMENGIKKATPLFICLIAVEISDVVFAVDSIPAVFGVTENPLIVFTSNMFAIMGLRSLYTILSKAAQDLEYLEPAVAVVLGFIGSKMVLEYFGILIPTELSLGVVLTFLSSGVGFSIYTKNQKKLENSGL